MSFEPLDPEEQRLAEELRLQRVIDSLASGHWWVLKDSARRLWSEIQENLRG
jgi:hypothetical protein